MSAGLSHSDQLIRAAKELQRLQTARAKHRRALRRIELELKVARRKVRALQADVDGRRPDVAPSRLHSGVVGYAAHEAGARLHHESDCVCVVCESFRRG